MKTICSISILMLLFLSCQGQDKPSTGNDKDGKNPPVNVTPDTIPPTPQPPVKDTLPVAPPKPKWDGISSEQIQNRLTEKQDTIAARVEYKGKHYSVFVVDPTKLQIQILPKPQSGQHSFKAINDYYVSQKKSLLFAMNGGMFERGGAAVGLMIHKGKTNHPVDTNTSKAQAGNFYMQPNGIFLIDSSSKKAVVLTTKDYSGIKDKKSIYFATQSGPMLVIAGKLNSLFKEGSPNLNIRNGVGIDAKGRAVFVISDEEVNFFEFASFFHDVLGCDNALYLDGLVSRMYLPAIGRNNLNDGSHLGPIITVIK